jgi:hypothetical protein
VAERRELPTLGDLVGHWIEQHVAIPDGPKRGDPYLLTEEMWRFLAAFYALDPDTGRWIYPRGGQLVRPQKWGKSPFGAAVAIAEAAGPTRLAGWDDDGNPLGRPHPTPLVQVTSVSEDSADNSWSALLPMIELGDIAHTISDTGITRVNLPGGGRIEPTTSSARSRHGQRVTFGLQDETHLWTAHDGGRKLADAQRRNLGGTGGRWLSITNAWDPIEQSVAQFTAEEEHEGVLHDDVDPGDGNLDDLDWRSRALERVYGDSTAWVDLERVSIEIDALCLRDAAQAERYYLNRKVARSGAAFDGERWDELVTDDEPPAKPGLWTLGVDGAIGGDSRAHDDFAVVACHVESGFVKLVGHWKRPEDAPEGYAHPKGEIDATVQAFAQEHEVYLAFVDPAHIWDLLAKWQGRHGERVFQKFVMRDHNVAVEVARLREGMIAGEINHLGDPVLAEHVKNAMKRAIRPREGDAGPLFTVEKESRESPRKIDAAVALVLAWAARAVAVANDAQPKPAYRAAGF